MNVIRAEYAGSCYGVERALTIAREVLDKDPSVSSLGPLIHNPRVVSELGKRGLRVAENPADVQTDTVIIRSHGVTPGQMRELEQNPVTIVDATCPYVLRAQRAAAALARTFSCVIVVGEEGHPEVDGLMAFVSEAGSRPVTVSRPEDLPADLPDEVGVVVQTTQRASTLQSILDELHARGIRTQVSNTICHATSLRQDAALELARQVDAMVVLGGKNSSNTTRLAEICATVCPKVFHIESMEDLDTAALAGCATVGLTAGASTPESQIVAVEAALQAL